MVSFDIFLKVHELVLLKRPIKFTEIPVELLEDFRHFITGKTIGKRGKELLAYPSDMLAWYEKLRTRGVDYELIVAIDQNAAPTQNTGT